MKNNNWHKIFGIGALNSDNKQEKITWKDNWRALQNLPKLFLLIWETSPSLTLTNAGLRLLQAAIPLSNLYIAKLIIDEIIRQINQPNLLTNNNLWTLIGVEFGLAFLSDILSRGINLSDALLGDKFANETSIRLMKHAARLDLAQFEDATFYDKLERARQQTVGRTVLMSQMLGQVQDLITLLFLASGLIFFNFWLILILIITVIPSFISESYFNRSSYSLVRNWTPERRELDYLRYVAASNLTAKEIKIFGLSNFLTQRFQNLANRYYQANKSLIVKRSFWGLILSALANIGYYTAYLYIAMVLLILLYLKPLSK